jgi:IS5 family transposase
MARRRIGQERLGVIDSDAGTALDQLAALIDWADIDRHLVGISAAPKGARGWPPLALFRAMLLAVWHDLSDVKLAEALADRASFRRFCGFAAAEPTPERTAFVRFRAELTRRALDRVLFPAITQQLVAKGVAVRTGSLVDATLIASASIRRDGAARWAGHRRRKPLHGYKAHVATDEAAGLIRGLEVTGANVHDAAELDAVLPAAPGDVYGDSAFAGSRAEAIIAARGGRARIVQAGTWGGHLGRTPGADTWGGAAALARLQEHNADVSRVRGRIEKVFGTCKRSYGMRRMRWLGAAKAGLQVRLTAIAFNLRRSWRLLQPSPA